MNTIVEYLGEKEAVLEGVTVGLPLQNFVRRCYFLSQE